ncbi:MAG: type 4a pilus biogenesis protein PilO [Rhodocyclaceae bacterium]|nr:type 4a pilus biogenesis protein PilO [Rhodocyclaceae bacterium]
MKKPSAPKIKMPAVDFKALAADFRGLDPQDMGAWPLIPRLTVLVVVFAAVVAAGWWFIWRDQAADLENKQAEEARLKEDWLNKKKQAVNLDEHRKQLTEIDRAFGALLRQLPNKSEMDSLLVDISQAGLGRGLQFEEFKPNAVAVKDFYAELPIKIRVGGNYHDLGAFAGDVAKLPRVVTLGEMSLEATKDAGILRLDAVATTYRYLDDEEVARIRKEKAAKQQGAKR